MVDITQRTIYQAVSDRHGLYSFPNLPAGHYELTISATRFATQRKTNLTVDTDSALQVDANIRVATQADVVTVTSNSGEQVETAANLSINGQRESSNGFMVNGIDVQEHMNGGTSIIPRPDFHRTVSASSPTNFDPEYGNYNGGIITVVSKSGAGQFHGNAFEFFRNTNLDAKGYFYTKPAPPSTRTSSGGAIGGPIKRDKIFFFTDYQGTRTTQGVSTGNISVPSNAERNGNFDDLTGAVSGPYLASLLTQKLGRTVTSGEPYTSVFPGRQHPTICMVHARKKPPPVHPRSQRRRKPVLDIRLLPNRPRRQGFHPHRRQQPPRPALRLLLHR